MLLYLSVIDGDTKDVLQMRNQDASSSIVVDSFYLIRCKSTLSLTKSTENHRW